MTGFAPADFDVFDEASAVDPDRDPDRVRLRDRLVDLHAAIYPEIRARRWDVHPHWVPRYLVSTARLAPPVTRIDFLLLRYSRPETVVQLMKKEFGLDLSHPYSSALVGVRIDRRGLWTELWITSYARADAENLKRRLAGNPEDKRLLQQIFADLGSEFSATLESPGREELAHLRCSRLVNAGALDVLIDEYDPGNIQLRVASLIPAGDQRLESSVLPGEVLVRLGQLYLLYQFIAWSPRNNHLSKGRPDSRVESTHDT